MKADTTTLLWHITYNVYNLKISQSSILFRKAEIIKPLLTFFPGWCVVSQLALQLHGEFFFIAKHEDWNW